jgi:hypothetical protein
MTPADVQVSLPQPHSGNYAVARFNALRHGVLSQHTVLPWEDGDEYRALLEALVAEHRPQGPTEEHLVEELAGIIWRKRRLRLAESAAHHRALMRATKPDHETAEAALIHVDYSEIDEDAVAEAITATDEQTIAGLADLESVSNMTEAALRLLNGRSPNAYTRALAKLHENTRESWEEQLARGPDDYEEDETPYSADAESLRRFLQTEIIPWDDNRRLELKHRPQIRAQAFGEAVEPDRLERLARYEVQLDRKFERTVAMLLKLQELRGSG